MDASPVRTVLISGGGIAGPALAHWLLRYGFEPTIVERAPVPRAGGQVVDLRGSSREVVDRMGLLTSIRAATMPERGTAFWDRRGHRVAELGAELFDGNGPVAEIEIMRGDLAAILAASAAGTEWIRDDTIVALDQHEDGVDVTFEHAAPRRFDLVVGADGLHSRTRALAYGPEDELLTHLGGYMAYFTVPMPAGLDDQWVHLHAMPGGKTIMLRTDATPGFAKAILTFRSERLEFDRRSRPDQETLLAETFADGTWVTPQVIGAMSASPDFYLDALGRVDLDHWSRGRVTLIGDAAFCGSPLTGQGTAMAVVGAYVLAQSLASAGGDHELGLAGYEETLRPYVRSHQALPGGGLKMMAPMTRVGIAAGLKINRLLARPLFKPVLAKMMPAEDAFVLPPEVSAVR